MRLRTLPLALSSIILASLLAYSNGIFRLEIMLMAILTTVLLQVLSNLANDYGDGVKGTDNEQRIGPQRALQSGIIQSNEMKWAVIVFAIAAFSSGLVLIFMGLKNAPLSHIVFFIVLGLAAVWAAVQYTVGKRAYGYRGLGDVFVLIFFGWVGVVGSYYMHGTSLYPSLFLPATSIGLLSMAVLNLNNMRDRESDIQANKITLAVRLGFEKAKVYHYLLLGGTLVCAISYSSLHGASTWTYLYLLVIPILILMARKVAQIQNPRDFDPMLKQTALTTLLFAVLFGLGFIL
jgi:1,4-dihydroxy-2-naphthoate polyprenyltransferase